MKNIQEEKIKNKRKNKILFIVIMVIAFVFLIGCITYGGIVYSLLGIELNENSVPIALLGIAVALIPLLTIFLISLYNSERRAKEKEIKEKIIELNDFSKKSKKNY